MIIIIKIDDENDKKYDNNSNNHVVNVLQK